MTMKTKMQLDVLNLQLFAEGGDGGTGAEGSTADSGSLANSTEGVNGNSTNVQTADAQTTDTNSVVDREAEFTKLIKGEYKDLFGKEVQNIVQSRLKNTKEQVAKLEALTPSLDLLSKRYGVDATDAVALAKAIQEDNSFYEDMALEMGCSTEEAKRVYKMQRENAELTKQLKEAQARENGAKLYQTWIDQAEVAKKIYPGLDLDVELKDERFGRILAAGFDVKAAYQLIHQDEILGGAMQYAAQTAEKKVTDKIMANGRRPSEGGISSQSASVVKTNVSQLTDDDIEEVLKQVRSGKRVVL